MKQFFYLLSFFFIAHSVFANDSTNKKAVVNIAFKRYVGNGFYIKLANKDIVIIDKYSLTGLKGVNQYFIQLQIKDTGILHFYLFHQPPFTTKVPTRVPNDEKQFSIPIHYKNEQWIYLEDTGRFLEKFRKKPILMNKEEFKKRYKKAYRRFFKKGFNQIITNIPINVEPNRNED